MRLAAGVPQKPAFATVRRRTVRTKGALSKTTTKLMVFKLVMTAAKTWRRLNGEKLLPKVVEGITFKDGIEAVERQPTSPPNRPSPKSAHSPCGIGDEA